MDTEDARCVVAELETKLADTSATEIALANEARRISYSALSDGDEGAKKALAKIDGDEVRLRQTQKHLRDAVDEAKRRLAEAERAEAMAAARKNGERAMAIADRIAARGRQIDEAFAAARAELDAFKADLDELHQLGVAHPRGEQFKVLGSLAVATHLMNLPFKIERTFLAPRERKTFTELTAGWRDGVANWAANFLDKAAA